jgi:SNF2 family DNA or RNA helicase
VLATLLKLKQVCNHPAQLLGDNSAIPARLLALDDRTITNLHRDGVV